MTTKFKTLTASSVANGSYSELEWTPDRDITIKKMLVNERSGTDLYNVQLYITISDVPYTRDYVPAEVIGKNPEYCWKPDLRVPKGAKIYVKVSNNSGSTISLDVIFEFEE